MQKKKILIVGGVAGGAAAAARIRRNDEFADIVMVERGEYISFANCGLPYYVGDVIDSRDKLLVQTPERMKARYNIDVRVNNDVLKISPKDKKAEIKDLANGKVYEESYDYLLLSPGDAPIYTDPSLADNDSVFTLKTINDADNIIMAIDSGAQSAVVVGGGFIGIEAAENLHEKGLDVTVVEKFDILTFMDADMSNYLKQHMKAKGVNVMTQTGLESVVRENGANKLTLEDGTVLRADAVLMCVGVRAESMLAKDAGLELTPNGAISVDAHMKTSDDSIYAVGDAVWVKNFVSGQHSPVPLAGPASKLARVAADNICGKTCTYDGVIATSVIKVFDLTGAATGLSEALLKRNNMAYARCYVHPTNHAGYYPGADPISLKLLFDPKTEKILGAQAVGTSGTEKRTDVLAAAIRSGMTVRDIAVLELCYAPPYGTSKDPVNAAGYVAGNIIDGTNPVFEYNDIENIDPQKVFLLDVRTKEENERACIPGSHHIPVDDLRERIGELPGDKEIWVYCRAGLRGYVAARILAQHGFNVKNLNGGYRTYQSAVACAHTDYDPFWD